MAKKPIYTGALAKRRPTEKRIRSKETDADRERREGEYGLTGFALLLKHYSGRIPVKDGDTTAMLMGLVIAMATDHVPYFQQPAKPRRKPDLAKWLKLELELEKEKKPTDRGESDAIRRLASRKPTRGSLANGMDEEALRKGIQRARESLFVPMLKRLALKKPAAPLPPGLRMPEFSEAELMEMAKELGQI